MERGVAQGLVIDSDIPLPDVRPGPAGVADVVYRSGPVRVVPGTAGPGRVLARMPRSDGDGAFYTLSETPSETTHGGWLLRFHDVCDVVIEARLDRATFHMDPAADPGLASVLANGLVLATILILRGHLVLHASAVEHSGAAVAVVGRSGMGKSTVSAILCRNGSRLVTDDLLRVDVTTDGVFCRLGSTESRLRSSADVLLAEHDRVRRTADGRSGLTPALAAQDELPLRCIVIPWPDRGATRVTATRASQLDALVLLSSFPRVVGWADPDTRGQQFAMTSDLVSRVPVLVTTLPWGPPFAPSLADDLLAALAGL